MYKTILVPLDGSQCSEAVLPHAEELAKHFGAALILLRVVDHAPPSVTTTAAQLCKEDVENEQKEAESYLADKKVKLEGKGVKATPLVLFGQAVVTIIQVARDHDVDLITMGSHGRSGLSRAFYGSVAAGVLHRVDRPLLLVRPEGS